MPRFPANLRSLLAELVSLPSVNPEGDAGGSIPGETRIAALLEEHLRLLGADVRTQIVAPGRPNVIAAFDPPRPARATIVFAPHLDTVGVAGMTIPPFALTPRAGRLHGRGACDTKGPMAALIWAFRRWTRSSAARRSDIRWVLAATVGEEAGSVGARALVESGFKADFAIALEPTDLRVVHAAKGVLRVWLETPGRACHGAQPERGDNAIYRALPLLQALRDDVAPALRARRHPLLGGASVNVGVITGGRDLNIVPDFCRLGLDLRTHPACDTDAVLALLRGAQRRHAPRSKLTIHRSGPSFVTERTEPWAQRLRAAGRGWATADWFCDANIFAAHGIPSVAFGPGKIEQAHTKDEYITTRALAEGADAFERFLSQPKPVKRPS